MADVPCHPSPGLEVAQPLLLLAGRGPRSLQRRPQDVLRLRLHAGHHHQQVSATPAVVGLPRNELPEEGCDPTAGLCWWPACGLRWHGLLGISARSITRSRRPARFEQAYVSSLIYGWDGEYFWTALQDINETGAFRWLSGDEVMYTHWNRDQPGKGAAGGGMGTSPPCVVGAGSTSGHGLTLRLPSSPLP